MCKIAVAPLVGAWIEISISGSRRLLRLVAPLVGAWIEIFGRIRACPLDAVAPLVGAWIEMYPSKKTLTHPHPSLPLWERGLKYPYRQPKDVYLGRSPCGSVD